MNKITISNEHLEELLEKLPIKPTYWKRWKYLPQFMTYWDEIIDALEQGDSEISIWRKLYQKELFLGKYHTFKNYVGLLITRAKKNGGM